MKNIFLLFSMSLLLMGACSKSGDGEDQIKLEGTKYVYNTGTGGGIYIRFKSASTCEFSSLASNMSPAGNTTSGSYSYDGTAITFSSFVGGYYLMPNAYTWKRATLSADGEYMYAVYLNEDGQERSRTFQKTTLF